MNNQFWVNSLAKFKALFFLPWIIKDATNLIIQSAIELESANSKNSKLEADLVVAQKTIDGMDKSIAKLKTDLFSQFNKTKDLRLENDKLQIELDSANSQVEKLQNENRDIKKTNESLQDDADLLNHSVNFWMQHSTFLKNQLDQIENILKDS